MKTHHILFVLLIIFPGILYAGGKPYYSIGEKEKHELITKTASVQVGDSYESVISKLGKPTFDTFLIEKERNEPIGRTLKYYTTIWEKGLVNEKHDKLILIVFDEADRVREIQFNLEND